MDELSAYLIEEIAMDGESGTDKQRFVSFIHKFQEEQQALDPHYPVSVVDDPYVNTVWKIFSKHPQINIGKRIPAASTSGTAEFSKQSKGTKKRQGDFGFFIDKVEVLAKDRPETFQKLYEEEYPGEVRIVVDEDLARLKITGSTNDKLVVGSTYATLQIAARGREEAVSSAEIGRLTGFDAKTVFSFIKRLIELELVIKFKVNENRVSMNYVLHRRYWDRSPRWLAVAQAEAEASAFSAGTGELYGLDDAKGEEIEDTDEPVEPVESTNLEDYPTMPREGSYNGSDEDDSDVESSTPVERKGVLPISDLHGMLSFPRMSQERAAAVMANSALLRSRLRKLMDKCKSHVVARPKLWERIGFVKGTKRERKLFNEVIRRLVSSGDVEHVWVDIDGRSPLACIRLTSSGIAEARQEGGAARDAALRQQETYLQEQLRKANFAYRANVTFERQVIDVIAASGSNGATVTDVAAQLNLSASTKRHVDEFLRKLDEPERDGNAQDLAVEGAKEMLGRERRIRFWTRAGIIQHYRAQAEQTDLLQEQVRILEDVDLEKLTNFATPNDERNWTSAAELFAELANPRDQRAAAVGPMRPKPDKDAKPRNATKPRKSSSSDTKFFKAKNPIDPVTGLPRKGRPRKSDRAPDKKRKAPADESGASAKRQKGKSHDNRTPSAGYAALQDDGETQSPDRPESKTNNASVEGNHRQLYAEAEQDDGEALSESAQRYDTPDLPTDAIDALGGSGRRNEPVVEIDQALSAPARIMDVIVANQKPDGHSLVDTSAEPLVRRRPVKKARLDLSAERRSRLLLDLLDAHGGLLDESYFSTSFERLVKEREGDQAATYLNELGDMREVKTRRRVYDALKSRGLINIKTIMAPMKSGGGYVQRNVVHRVDVPSEVLDQYLKEVAAGKRTRQPNQYSGRAESGVKITIGDMDFAQAQALAADQVLVSKPLHELIEDPGTQAMFSQARMVVAQQYGLIVGSIGKLSFFHKYIMRCLAVDSVAEAEVKGVLSMDDGVVDIDRLINAAPLDVFSKLKTPLEPSAELEAALADPTLRSRPMSSQSEGLKANFDLGATSKNRRYFEQLIASLFLLGLATAVHEGPFHHFGPFDRPPASHNLYRFKLDELPHVALRPADVNGTIRVHNIADAESFWLHLFQHRDVYAGHLSSTLKQSDQLPDLPSWTKPALIRLRYDIGKSTRWNAGYQLSKRQSNFIQRFATYPADLEPGTILQDREMLKKIATITMAPVRVVEQRITTALGLSAGRGRNVKPVRDKQQRISSRRGSTKQLNERGQGEDGEEDGQEEDREEGEEAWRTPEEAEPASPQLQQLRERLSEQELEERQASQQAAELRKTRAMQWHYTLDEIWKTHDIDGPRQIKLADATRDLRGRFLDSGDCLLIELLSTMVRDALNPSERTVTAGPAGSEASHDQSAQAEAVEGGDADTDGQEDGQEDVKTSFAPQRRRVKITWSREADELLRDAGVVLTVREGLRSSGRSNWTIIKPLFPGKTIPQIRRRYFEVLTRVVGEEAYLAQLAKEWQKLWELYRGTAILPDSNPRKADGFDLQGHVDFLRRHIDKEEVLQTVERAATTASLTLAVEDFEGIWGVKDHRTQSLLAVHDPTINVTNGSRVDTLSGQAFALQMESVQSDDVAGVERLEMALTSGRERCAVKMCIDTPAHLWSEAAAVDFVMAIGERAVAGACKAMLASRHIRVALPEGRRLPGRNFVYTEEFLKRRQASPVPIGDLARESRDAHEALIRQLQAGDEVEMEEDDEAGDTIAAAQLLCDGTIEPVIDLDHLNYLKNERMFNSRALIDQDLLFPIGGIKAGDAQSLVDRAQLYAAEVSPIPDRASVGDWLPLAEDAAGARDSAFNNVVVETSTKSQRVSSAEGIRILQTALDAAGKSGIPLSDIRLDIEVVKSVVEQSSKAAPMAFLAGYDCPRIVSGMFLLDWAVKVALTSRWIMPRCWLTMEGHFIESRWRGGIEQLLGHLFVYCGATRARLCELLSPQWDRLEVCDLIRGASSTGVVDQRFVSVVDGETFTGLEAEWHARTDEEIFVAPKNKPWYGFLRAEEA